MLGQRSYANGVMVWFRSVALGALCGTSVADVKEDWVRLRIAFIYRGLEGRVDEFFYRGGQRFWAIRGGVVRDEVADPLEDICIRPFPKPL